MDRRGRGRGHGLIVGGAGGALLAADNGSPAPVVLAQAALDPLPGHTESGTALVEMQTDGGRVLVVTLEGGPPSGNFREVWLIDSGVQRLVSLGVLEGSTGRFTVPDGLDLDAYPIVGDARRVRFRAARQRQRREITTS